MNDRFQLPIYAIRDSLVRVAQAGGQRLVLRAPTGSGKSTQVPQMLLDAGIVPDGRRLALLEPRRLAARLLAARVAQERQTPLGEEVGYQIRFEDRTRPDTRIVYVTEGLLLRQMLSDPELRRVGVLVFDEFHERHLFGDVTLAMALQLQRTTRPDLTIIVMSATLDSQALETYLRPCTVLETEGRLYPVRTEYLARSPDPLRTPPWETAADATARLVRDEPDGDVLVFMPGAYEIHRTIQALNARPEIRGCTILPLHGELPPRDQDAAVAPTDRRKIIVATNVAETSLTIEGVRLVVDAGLARVARFDPYRGIDTLLIERISKASAEQRAGRAGRTAPGVCVRLWTEREQAEKAARDVPEIRRVDLAETALMLKAAGHVDVAAFPWFDAPDPKSLHRALTLLQDLGAVDERTGAITDLGRRMLAFPVHPRYSRMMLAAETYGCVRTAALIAALTQDRSLLVRRPGTDAEEHRERALGEERTSDLFLLMRAWLEAEARDYDLDHCRSLGIHAVAARQVGRTFDAFVRIAAGQGLALEDAPRFDDGVRRCLLAGFADQVGRRLDGGTLRCDLVHGRRGVIERASVVRASQLVVAADVREVESGGGRDLDVLLSNVTAIEPTWLEELFPGAMVEEPRVRLDPDTKRVTADTVRRYHDLVLETKRGGTPGEAEAARILADEVIAGRCALKHWDHAVDQWIARVNGLARWCPELGVPPIGDDDRHLMIGQICVGATSVKDVKDRPVLPVVKSWLDHRQQALVAKHTPERLDLPNGRQAKVVYAESAPPTIAVRIQDLYGVERSLSIAMGRQPVTIQVLAPNFRPVQVTSDLETFWREGYPRVKRELQRKYPKHQWR